MADSSSGRETLTSALALAPPDRRWLAVGVAVALRLASLVLRPPIFLHAS